MVIIPPTHPPPKIFQPHYLFTWREKSSAAQFIYFMSENAQQFNFFAFLFLLKTEMQQCMKKKKKRVQAPGSSWILAILKAFGGVSWPSFTCMCKKNCNN